MSKIENDQLYKIAFSLAVFTIPYNIGEGLISTYFGYEDESLALFGFGSDSFIEVISGLGIAHMVIRIQRQPNSNRGDFEQRALKITGFTFYTLVFGLVITSLYNIWNGHKPETTFWGIIISLISIFVMWFLVYGKRKVGRKLNSEPILADANCTIGMHIYVKYLTGKQWDLRINKHSLYRQHWNTRTFVFCIQRRKRMFRKSK